MTDAPPHPTKDLLDWKIAALIALAAWALILPQLGAPGVTWDEAAPNIPAAQKQGEWIRGLFSLDAPFSKETIDAYWTTTSDHPSLPRTIAAVSRLLLMGWVDELVALRAPSALIGGLLAASVFLFLRPMLSRAAALAGALSLLFMPRVFGHLHLFSLDVPIMAWWFWAGATGYNVIERRWPPWLFGVAYAIAFTTKLHSVFLPFPLLLWALLHIAFKRQDRNASFIRLAQAIGWAAAFTPILYVGLQPWLWHDALPRIIERFFDYAEKSTARPIALFYLGTIYHGDSPWHYPLVMLLLTLPATILALLFVGLFSWTRGESRFAWNDARGLRLFLLLHFLTPLSLVILPLAQPYDGCRLFLPCFPFAACLAGWGAQRLFDWTRRLPAVVAQCVFWALLAGPFAMTAYQIHPHYLAYYNSLAGGVSGAHELGMETTYWCDSLTRDMLDVINETVPPGATLRPLSMPYEVIDYYKQRGWLRDDIVHTADPPYDFHLLQSRQGMFTQAEATLYFRRKPLAAIEIGGVRLYALYGKL